MRSKGSVSFKFAVPLAVVLGAGTLLPASVLSGGSAHAAGLKVMQMGVGDGTIASTPPGINCGRDCAETYGSDVSVTLKATAPAGSKFLEWLGDCSGTADTCKVDMAENRWVRARFDLHPAPELTAFTPEAIEDFLFKNPSVNTPALSSARCHGNTKRTGF